MSEVFIQLKEAEIRNPYEPEFAEIEMASWEIRPGEFWLLGGPQNSGKSSLIGVLSGMLQARNGEALLFGQSLAHSREEDFLSAKQRVGTVLDQGGRILHQLLVWENLALPLRYHREWNESKLSEKVDKLLERGGLQIFAKSSPASLSALLKQRVAILRATAMEPDVLILDKPLLEPNSLWVQNLLKEWVLPGTGRKHPGAVVVASDNLSDWESLASHVALIKNKRLIVPGRVETYLAQKPELLKDFWAEHL